MGLEVVARLRQILVVGHVARMRLEDGREFHKSKIVKVLSVCQGYYDKLV